MENINQLIANRELDAGQMQLFEKYQSSKPFQKILEGYFYYELPHLLDYFILKEKEVGNLEETFSGMLQQQKKYSKEAQQIREAFLKKNKWTKKLKDKEGQVLTTASDLTTIDQLCHELAKRPRDADAILVHFFDQLVKAKKSILRQVFQDGSRLADIIEEVPDQWYSEPWYYIYVQYFGTDEEGLGHFGQLKKMLDYLDTLGIKNIYILPHYESPNGDAGYDISDYRPAKAYGGLKAFQDFMEEALSRGFRVATDLVFNHCSVEHAWFRKAVAGNSKYFNYFLKCPAHWQHLNIQEVLKDEEGDLYLYLPERNETGESVISKRILIFPDVDQTLWLARRVAPLEKEVSFYREFYPFQVDMDIQQPEVILELFQFLGEEMAMGIFGKRTDAIAHWVKKPGTDAKNLPATYALQKLIKQFLKHANPKTIILPEVVTTSKLLKGYAGERTTINGKTTTTGGDALLDFQLQAMLREMIYFQKTNPFWTQVFDLGPTQNSTSVALIPIEHHDETYMGFIQEIGAMRQFLSGSYTYLDKEEGYMALQRGIVYKNGMSVGARYADALNRDLRKICNALFCLYMMPGVPVIYYGTEIGAYNHWEHMHTRQQEQFATFAKLLGPDMVGPGKVITIEQCEDPRELQRGPISAETFFGKAQDHHPGIELIAELNQLRKQYSALRSTLLSPIDTYDASILGMIKYPIGPPSNDNPPIVALSNLSERPLTAKIPFYQLQQKLSTPRLSFETILNLKSTNQRSVEVSIASRTFDPGTPESLEIELSPFSSILFSADLQTI
ncbi:MAG: alpha-amylase family glycosyl hydrolase [Bacteroidota bacterium]